MLGRILMYVLTRDFVLIDFITYLLQTVMIAVTLIVVAVPEGLPMAISLSLAYSMRRMLKTNNLVRRMHACETMGAATVICTDKTGTLTQNQMKVAEIVPLGTIDTIQENLAINSTAQLDLQNAEKPLVLGNPTEGALLLWLHEQGTDYRQLREQAEIVDEQPFSTERKYMATTIRRQDGTKVRYVKGAPEVVMGMCNTQSASVKSTLLKWQQQAMRTLAVASQQEGEQQPTLNALVAISDPVRPDVPAAVKECLDAGIQVKIVTGDTPGTAREIGRQVGLWTNTDGDENIITGPEFATLTDKQLLERVENLKIIARARPMDKRRLVEALQQRNEVVAVTGDGTNDAPALKAAHVGLSMGDGTSVAKEASDITIIDNSFSSIGRAVMWGRSLYQNIQRFILFQLTVNVVACLVVLVGAFTGTESPLTVTQMLWVNLIMDTFAAMAFATLPPSAAVMHDKPRSRQAFIISKTMWQHIWGIGLLFTAALLVLLFLPSTLHLSPSTFFTIFVMLQFWNMFNTRAFATGRSAFHLRGCKGFLLIAALIFLGQVLIINLGGAFFNVEPLSLQTWLITIGATSLVLWTGEVARLLTSKRKA